MRVLASTLAGVAAIGALAAPISGYWANGQKWRAGASIVMHLQQSGPSGTLIDGSSDWNGVIESALGIWNPFLNGVTFRVVRDSTAAVGLRNSANNVIFADDVYGDSFGDAVAVTRWLYQSSDRTFVEADVVFNRGRSWNSYRGSLRGARGGGTLYDLRRVALHEFGHVLGLGHPNEHGQTVTAVMNSRVSHVDTVQGDDAAGLASIYGTPPQPLDRMVSGGRLLAGQSLTSGNGRFHLIFQSDGNLALYDHVEQRTPWSSNTAGIIAGSVFMQPDGNLVVYDAQGLDHWSSGTPGNAGAYLVVQNDGNLVIYRTDGESPWDRYR